MTHPIASAIRQTRLAESSPATVARALEARGALVRRGAFREHMEVELVNDGPVTLWIDATEL